jgi:CDP-glycerol glycerophosphotransferase (TagB/SpsB family)
MTRPLIIQRFTRKLIEMPTKSKMTVMRGIRHLFWYIVSIPVTWFAAILKDRVILASNRGEGLSGNARYLFETWLKNGAFDVWIVVSSKKQYQKLSMQYDHVLFAFSWKAVKVTAQARFFILTHGRLDVPFSGFKKTIIQTWHGIPFKAIGFYRNHKIRDRIRNILYKWFDYDSIDYFLSSSPYVTKLYSHVFRQKPCKFLETGFPRNDAIVISVDKSTSPVITILKEKLPAFKNVMLYAPTYRPYPSVYFPFNDSAEMLPGFIELLKRTDSVCIVKSHPNQQHRLDAAMEESGRVIDISDDGRLPDLQNILPEIDILITDYSSVSIDALLLDMPCVFINSDIEDYVCATGEFCCDYDSLAAGAHVQSMASMVEALNELIDGNDRFREKRSSALELFLSPSSDTSTERLSASMQQLIK